MDFGQLINLLPLWLLFLLTTCLSLLATAAGTWLAVLALRYETKEPEAPLGSLVGAVLGLLAFILAFTFGMTGARFDARRHLVLEESNAIGTCYLRAGLLPKYIRQPVRTLLQEYVDIRLNGTSSQIEETITKSEIIHDKLWAYAEDLSQRDFDSELRALFIISLNEVIDLHQSRKTVGLANRIPGPIWFSVYLLSILTMMAIGYQVGMTGSRWLRGMPLLAAAFSLVIMLIADIDRPGEGHFTVSQEPLQSVKKMMSDKSP